MNHRYHCFYRLSVIANHLIIERNWFTITDNQLHKADKQIRITAKKAKQFHDVKWYKWRHLVAASFHERVEWADEERESETKTGKGSKTICLMSKQFLCVCVCVLFWKIVPVVQEKCLKLDKLWCASTLNMQQRQMRSRSGKVSFRCIIDLCSICKALGKLFHTILRKSFWFEFVVVVLTSNKKKTTNATRDPLAEVWEKGRVMFFPPLA